MTKKRSSDFRALWTGLSPRYPSMEAFRFPPLMGAGFLGRPHEAEESRQQQLNTVLRIMVRADPACSHTLSDSLSLFLSLGVSLFLFPARAIVFTSALSMFLVFSNLKNAANRRSCFLRWSPRVFRGLKPRTLLADITGRELESRRSVFFFSHHT